MSYQAQGDPLQAHRSGDTSAKPQLLSTANFLPPPLPHDKPLKTQHGTKGHVRVEIHWRRTTTSRRKGFQTHLVPKEMEARGVDERGRRRARFYTAPAPPQAHSHCTRAVIFQRTHLQSKISYLMAQVVLWFPSTLPLHFLISDMTIKPSRLF